MIIKLGSVSNMKVEGGCPSTILRGVVGIGRVKSESESERKGDTNDMINLINKEGLVTRYRRGDFGMTRRGGSGSVSGGSYCYHPI